MTEKYKKIEREYVLSDSSVNEYGFRLLTSGYQLESFRKNPIGYYMHRREEGIVLKWEDLRIEDDKLLGTPVINLANGRGQQTCEEAAHGFLNAASVGHIVVLDYSTDPELMLPGQTGPTITKWYNKECSLVDIPGNCNALTRLYDDRENELNLADLAGSMHTLAIAPQPATLVALRTALALGHNTDDAALLHSVQALAAQAGTLATENQTLRNDHQQLQQQLAAHHEARSQYELTALLDRALEDKKITIALRHRLAKDYAGNAAALKDLIAAMPAYRSIADQLKSRQNESATATWQWDDYEQNDPAGNKLKDLRANDPTRYKELFDRKFAV